MILDQHMAGLQNDGMNVRVFVSSGFLFTLLHGCDVNNGRGGSTSGHPMHAVHSCVLFVDV